MTSPDAHARRHGDRFTIVVVPSGAYGQQVLEAAAAWTTSGLLTAAAWVRPEDAVFSDAAAPQVTCQYVGRWGQVVTDLFATLGQYRRELVRVVCCQVLDSPAAVDTAQVAAATRLLEAVRYSVPAVVERDDVGRYGTQVIGINTVTGITGLSGVPRNVIRPGWDLTAVSSPEDRRDPSRANTWVRAGENLTSVAVTTTAVVGGLFAGVPQGPFDSLPGDASAVDGKTIVMRSTIRAVVGERTVQEVARRAVAAAPATGGPARSEPGAFTTSFNDTLITETADWLDQVDRAALNRQDIEPEPETPLQFMTIRQGFVAFIRFYGQALASGPAAVWAFAVRRAESVATGALVGGSQKSGITLTVAPRASDALGPELASMEAADIALAHQAIRDAGRLPVRLPTAQMWQSLRDASVGLLDGSAAPSGAPVQLDGARRVLLSSPDLIAPTPTDTFTVPEAIARQIGIATDAQRTIAACAPTTAERVRDRLAQACEARRAVAEEAATDAEEAIADADAEEDADGPAHAELAQRSERAQTADEDAAVFEAELARLDAWLASRSGSLMWTVGTRIQQRLADAHRVEDEAAQAATMASGLSPDRPAQLRRRFLNWFVVILAVTAVTAAGLVQWNTDVVTHVQSWHLTQWLHEWEVWVAWVAALLVWLTLTVRSWYVGILRYLRQFTQAWNVRAAALWRYRAANSDRRRLEEAATQAEDWADVIGWSTHTPWSTQPQPLEDDFVTPDPSLLPESMRLAQPSLDEAGLARATDLAVAKVTNRGWRRRAYERLVASGLNTQGDADLSRALVSIDEDPAGSAGARSRLREVLATGAPQDAVVAAVIEEAADELRVERLGVSRLRVQVDDPQPDEPADVDDADFLGQALVPASPLATETWSERARVAGAHTQIRSLAWGPPDAAQWAAPTVDMQPVVHTDGRRDLVDVVVRVDMTEWVDVDDLRLFERGAAPVTAPVDDSFGDFV